MKFVCYPTGGEAPEIRPASAMRPWMDRLPHQFAYRCLPMNIANAHGWDILCPSGFSARWTGGAGLDAIAIEPERPGGFAPVSHFGTGVLTFHPGYLFETEPGFNLWVSGPLNERRHGIVPLTGVVETDWSPYSFTMNWAFTAPEVTVRFAAGDAFCTIFPIPRGYLDTVEPEIADIANAPERDRNHRQWQDSRRQFLVDLPNVQSEAHRDRWQKGYFRGNQPDGTPAPDDHQTKLRLKPVVDRRHKP